MIKTVEDLSALQRSMASVLEREKVRVLVCAGTGCVANGSLKVYDRIKELVQEKGLYVDVELLEEGKEEGVAVSKSGCHGFCEMGPLVRIEPEGYLYTKVTCDDADEIVQETLINGNIVWRLVYHNPITSKAYKCEDEIPFYAGQKRVALEHCGRIDPEDIMEYIGLGGYKAIEKAVTSYTPEEVCKEISASGLRGRGGGGFPTGRKWEFTRVAPGDVKYVVCNGDEGDPGAFMDRSLMEGDPHRVIEGMMIAAYGVGAEEGYIYVRAEYPLAVKRLKKAIEDAKSIGLLGDGIFGTDFSFDLHVKEGAGAFVCGEETALLASIEGKRGMPRPKPPFPATNGLWNKPTLLNNVETLANVPVIINRGAEWFRTMGTPTSPGTKTFALTGQVLNTGLIEVPMGLKLREIIFDIGGGLRGGKEFKAVQIGGPSGGCLYSEHLDLTLDYDALAAAGAMIGSGGLVVMDEDTCIVEVARFFMNFTQNESCGKCVLCREGTQRMLQILEKIVKGRGVVEDLDMLEEIALAVRDGSLCGLGKTAPNPVLTTLKYFRDEYLAHVVEKRCPAHVCQSFKAYRIVAQRCTGCSRCSRVCPQGAISGKLKEPFVIDLDKCIACGACREACKFGAIEEVWK